VIQSPFGDRVGAGAGEVEGCEGVEAFDVPALAYACHPAPVAGEVVGMDLFDRLFANLFLGSAYASGRLDARDGPIEARAGDPEARRHVPGPFVLYDARKAERAPGSDPERSGEAAELTRDGFKICRGFRHQVSGFGFSRLAALRPQSETLAPDDSVVVERLLFNSLPDTYSSTM
jgi:hypothetical protein